MLQDLLGANIAPNQTSDLTEEAIEQFYTYGYAQYKFGNTIQAADVFRRLCEAKPLESRFWFALGACYQEAKQYEAAINAWAMAAGTEPGDPYPHFHAAECACSLQEFEKAKICLKEAQELVAKEKTHPLQQRLRALFDALGAGLRIVNG